MKQTDARLYDIHFLTKPGIRWEIQQPIKMGGLMQPSAEVFICRFTVVRDIFVLSSSLQCSVVKFYRSAKGNKWFEKRCKVNFSTLVSSAPYRVT
jgi:hypothetical protein